MDVGISLSALVQVRAMSPVNLVFNQSEFIPKCSYHVHATHLDGVSELEYHKLTPLRPDPLLVRPVKHDD